MSVIYDGKSDEAQATLELSNLPIMRNIFVCVSDRQNVFSVYDSQIPFLLIAPNAGVPWWFSGLRIWYCQCHGGSGHCCGISLIPGPRTSACHGHGKKIKKLWWKILCPRPLVIAANKFIALAIPMIKSFYYPLKWFKLIWLTFLHLKKASLVSKNAPLLFVPSPSASEWNNLNECPETSTS